ncbi:MAG: class I tRNA ligase family protein, partial [Candidatus Taylorbacteria bacterium]|nr:class I tRNA ligase family protein [Candidatus Taylorbacteria bacterium]
ETGYEILFFWVARMIMMTGYNIGTIPFHTIYLHGTVRDAKGRKMSKTLGNGIDPLDISAKFGADAGRMALVIGNTPGTDMNISEDKIKGYKNFANKVWNVSRFILENTKDTKHDENFSTFSEKDSSLIKEQEEIIKDITKDMEDYRFYMAGEKIYHYIWDNLADVILEESKKIFLFESASSASNLRESATLEKESRKQFLLETLSKILIILHPFMPFLTEEIWQSLSESKSLIMIEKWPV